MAEHDDKLTSLLLKWEEAWERGINLPVSQLCAPFPELADRLESQITRLKKMAWMKAHLDDEENLPEEDDEEDQLIGTVLAGRYRIELKLGEGGFGRVYRAFDLELQRYVAVKVGHSRRAQSPERLLNEARQAARLRHPGIVTVHDVGRHDGSVFLVTELIEGQTLAERIAGQRFSPEEAARLIADVADALSIAHEQGFIHRDIKPSNILLDRKGRPRLADFGITIRRDDSAADMSGTPDYMSPEQAKGKALDARSDIYSLGVVLFQLLAGERYTSSNGTASRNSVLRSVVPRNLKRLTDICQCSLAERPDDRFATAGELAVALRSTLDHSPRRLNVIVLLLGFAVLGILIWRSMEWWPKFRNRPNSTHEERAEILPAFNREQAATEDSTPPEPLVNPKPIMEAPDERLNEPPGEVAVLWGHFAYVNCLAVSQDGQRLVSGSNDHSVRMWDLSTRRMIWTNRDFQRNVRAVSLADNEQTVWACDGESLRELDATNGMERSLHSIPLLRSAKFSSDGHLLFVIHFDGSGRVYDTSTKESVQTIPEPHTVYGGAFVDNNEKLLFGTMDLDELELSNGYRRHTPFHQASLIESVAVSPGDRFLVTGSGKRFLNGNNQPGDHALRVWDYSQERMLHELIEHKGFIWAVAFTRDGRRFLSGGGGDPDDFYGHRPGTDTRILLWNVADGKLIHSFEGHKAAIQSLLVFPDGRHAASGSADSTIRIWRLPD